MIEADKTDKIIQCNQDVFDKLFNMMEKITERIVLMENVLWMLRMNHKRKMENGPWKENGKWQMKWKMTNEMENEKWNEKLEVK